MDVFISVACYFIIVLLAVFLSSYKFRVRIRVDLSRNRRRDLQQSREAKISLAVIILIALLFVLYNVLVTKMNPSTTSDRRNYALNFYGIRASQSAGLTTVIKYLRHFSSNVESLFYVTTFLTMAITLLAYRIDPEATPSTLLFLFSSQYVFFSLECLKQAYANAFSALCLAFALRNEGREDKVLSIVALILAIYFHHTGFFLIPILIMLRMRKTKKRVLWSFFALVILILFLEPLLLKIASIVAPYASLLATKIYQYIGDSSSEDVQTEGFLTFVKGFPFYVITLIGWLKRKSLVDKITNYDNYLFLSGVLCLAYLATIYNSWIYRFSYFFYLAEGAFFSLLIRNIKNPNNKIIIKYATLGVLSLLTFRFVLLMYMNFGGL